MGFLNKYFEKENKGQQIDSIKKIVDSIIEIDSEQADHVAMVAFLLARVAYSDLNISLSEKKRIKEIIISKYNFKSNISDLIMELAVAQNISHGGTDNYLISREFKNSTTINEREDFLKFLFEVACADNDISADEEAELKLIAKEMGVSDNDFVLIRREYSEFRLGRFVKN